MENKLKTVLKKPLTLASHHDANGVTSAVELSYAFIIRNVKYPEEFGDVDNTVDIVTDMRPKDPNYSGIVIDHHPGHPEDRNYHLIYDDIPTSLIVYNIVKDQIPDRHKWKMAVGLVGDGRPELIPTEVWDLSPELQFKIAKQKTSRSGFRYLSEYPVWMLLSAPINYSCRSVEVGPLTATRLLKAADNPLDIINERAFKIAREQVDTEINAILKDYPIIDFGKVLYGEVDSANRIHGLLASRLGKKDKVCIIVNKYSGSIAVRGVFAKWLSDKLIPLGFELGGHAGYMGGRLKSGQTSKQLLNAIRKVSK